MKRRLLCALLAAMLTLSACSKPFSTDAEMCSFRFSHSGMHSGLIYTLSAAKGDGGWRADLSLLAGDREYTFALSDAEAAGLAALVEAHGLTGWNGFDRVDKHALDGYDFELAIGYEDGQTVWASGSNAFPDGYRAAREAIVDYFGKLMDRNGIENPL